MSALAARINQIQSNPIQSRVDTCTNTKRARACIYIYIYKQKRANVPYKKACARRLESYKYITVVLKYPSSIAQKQA